MSLQKKICQWGKYFEKATEKLLISMKYYFLGRKRRRRYEVAY